MTNLRIERFSPNQDKAWKKFIENSNNGTIFHQLDFLAYHGERFKRFEHHLVWFKNDQIIALMPLAILNEKGKKVARSPYGASWGGIVEPVGLKSKYALEIVSLLVDYLKKHHVDKVYITPTPQYYFKDYSNFFEYALSVNKFKLINRETMFVVELPSSKKEAKVLLDKKCRNQAKCGQKYFKKNSKTSLSDFYNTLMSDKIRHHAKPTHTQEELAYLLKKLPNQVLIEMAGDQTGAKVGICYFTCNKKCILTFYMAQDDQAIGKNGLNALIVDGLERAVERGYKFLDFGSASLKQLVPNPGLAEFKEGFGAKGFSKDTYYLKLTK